MKRTVVLVAVTLLVAMGASAKDYQSSFGFAFSAPESWLVMTKQELATNPVLAKADAGIKAKVESGAAEFLYETVTSDATFTDYVDVKLGVRGVVPKTPEDLKTACSKYAQALAKATGRTLEISKCEDRDVGAAKTFYVEYEGRVAGTVAMQYQLVRPDGRLLYVTATCKPSSLDKLRPEFQAIVKSIRFN